jgi:hypothetical protein
MRPVGMAVFDAGLRFVRINERLAALKGASVEAHLGRAPGAGERSAAELAVAADPIRLAQIFDNRLGNACRCTPRDGTIGVPADAGGDAIEFRAADTGFGLEADDLEAVFELFVQIDPGGERAEGGPGPRRDLRGAAAAALRRENGPGAVRSPRSARRSSRWRPSSAPARRCRRTGTCGP